MARHRTKKKVKVAHEGPILGVESVAEDIKSIEEKAREATLFGSQIGKSASTSRTFSGKGKQRAIESDGETGTESIANDKLFFLDVPATASSAKLKLPTLSGGEDSQSDTDREVLRPKLKKAVWHDPADEALSVSLAKDNRLRKLRTDAKQDSVNGLTYAAKLRQQFEKVHPTPAWASMARQRKRKQQQEQDGPDVSGDEAEIERDASALLRRYTRATSTKTKSLLPHTIDIERCRDANQNSGMTSKRALSSLQFHPYAPVLLTTNSDRRLRLFSVDGKHNELLQSLHIPELPLTVATINPSGTTALLAGNASSYFAYDLQSGRVTKRNHDIAAGSKLLYKFNHDGSIVTQAKARTLRLLDWRAAGQVLGELQSNAPLVDAAWTGEFSLCTYADNSEVYVWDTRMLACVSRWKDEGGFGALSLTSGDRYVATSSSAGIVNVYDSNVVNTPSEGPSKERQPLKTLLNLTTAVDTVCFSRSAQLMAFASSAKQDAFKLIHTPTMTVYSNWPTLKSPLGRVTAVDFSHDSQYVAIGNDAGKALLYRLKHFSP